MRVIAGRAKGHHLKGPKGAATRPTSDKVRGAIFAMIESLLATEPAEGDDQYCPLSGRRVLDLYAGTGALGIEAVSRGAATADFVEVDGTACRVIRENLAHTKLDRFGQVHCTGIRPFLHRATAAPAAGYDLIIADPPYSEPGLEDTLGLLVSTGLIKPDGLLVVEHASRRALPDEIGHLARVKFRRHGDTAVSIYGQGGQG